MGWSAYLPNVLRALVCQCIPRGVSIISCIKPTKYSNPIRLLAAPAVPWWKLSNQHLLQDPLWVGGCVLGWQGVCGRTKVQVPLPERHCGDQLPSPLDVCVWCGSLCVSRFVPRDRSELVWLSLLTFNLPIVNAWSKYICPISVLPNCISFRSLCQQCTEGTLGGVDHRGFDSVAWRSLDPGPM